MEEDIRKQGVLYLQHQRFGKKWKRVWCVLYRESSCSISRLEFFECKDGGNVELNEKSLRKQQEHKKVIRLADCIRVTELELDGAPRDTGTFLVETTEKIYVFAADRKQLEDWTHTLCEIAFPVRWMDVGAKRGHQVDEDQRTEDNSLYSGRDATRPVCDFRVCVRRTEASDRCGLRGEVVLRSDLDSLQLLDRRGDVLLSWPYRYLRRFGRDKSTFSFEAGRRCQSGEGSFEFETRQGNLLFQAVDGAINLHRSSLAQQHTSASASSHVQRQASASASSHVQRQTSVSASSLVQRKTSSLDPVGPESPKSQNLLPLNLDPADQARSFYSTVTETSTIQYKDREQHHPLMVCGDSPLRDEKSLTLDSHGLLVPRKNQVKMMSSCPLPHADPDPYSSSSPIVRLSPKLSSGATSDQTYSQITLSGKTGGLVAPPPPKEPEYSLPFDTITQNSRHVPGGESGPDPLYDSIDDMIFGRIVGTTYAKVEHIYDEPEGRTTAAAAATAAAMSVYDDPEEMRGDAWRVMGTNSDPKGHQYPYNPRVDDYAVPKRAQRDRKNQKDQSDQKDQRDQRDPLPSQTTDRDQKEEQEKEEQEEEEEKQEVEQEEQEEEEQEKEEDSPYNNVIIKMSEMRQ